MTAIRILGEVETPAEPTADDLRAMPAEARVADVKTLGSARSGAAASLSAVLALARPKPSARYITFSAPADGFRVSVPLEDILPHGWIVYEADGAPLDRAKGGPFRLVIPDPAACGGGMLDECVNVKFLGEIILTAERGPDSRPADDQAHEELHRAGTPHSH